MRVSHIFMVMILALLSAGQARAGVNVVQELYFGKVLMRDADVEGNITVSAAGGYTASYNFTFLEEPREGIYEIDGFDEFAVPSKVTIEMGAPITAGSKTFTLDGFSHIIHNGGQVNAQGILKISIGARANSDGGSFDYAAGEHSGQITIAIDF